MERDFGQMARSRGALVGVVASLAVHLTLMAVIISLPPSRLLAPPSSPPTFFSVSTTPGEPEPTAEASNAQAAPLQLGGAQSADNVDGPLRGMGGDGGGAQEVIFFVSRSHDAWLQDTPLNATSRSQAQRIRTGRGRSSWENRRATPNPEDAPFLASGSGTHRQRRAVARVDAAEGALEASAPSIAGRASNGGESALSAQTTEGSARDDSGEILRQPQTRSAGGAQDSPGRGIAHGRGQRRSDAARVAHARPPLDEGPAATLAPDAQRVMDNRDAELLARQLLQSHVDASRHRGHGEGRGGQNAPGAPGHGADAREGGQARALMPGSGAGGLDTHARRYRTWYLAARRRVEDRLVFPRARMVAMDQGLAVYRLQVTRDGQLAGAPRRLRSSGFADLDAAALEAILAGAPFAPVPTDVAPGRSVLSVDMRVEFSNPMFR